MRSRIACIHLPALPLQALLRAEPALRGRPVAVVAGTEQGRGIVEAASAPARAAGVRRGLSTAQATARCSGLLLRRSTDELEAAASEALYDAASAFSPQVELARGQALLEVGDLGQLFPSEPGLGEAMRARVAQVGLHAQVAIADQPAVARVLALCHAGVTVVPTGEERAALAGLPLGALMPSPAQAALLSRWGLRTVGDLAALPRKQVVARLGRDGLRLHRLACAEDDTPLTPTPPPPLLTETAELEDPLDNLEPLSFVLRGLLDRMMARLLALHQACGELTLRLHLTDKSTDERPITLAVPTRSVSTLLDLVRTQLASRPPATSVRALVVQTVPQRSRPVQLSLLTPTGPLPDKLAMTLARLVALCGEGQVGRPVVPDSHLPGEAAIIEFPTVEATTPRSRGEAPGEAAEPPPHLLTAHIFRPPREVTVQARGHAIESITGALAGSLAGAVRKSGGPYRLRAGGLRKSPRDYYDVELVTGDALRLFHDLREDRWFLDARYD
jgi:protein ImuB